MPKPIFIFLSSRRGSIIYLNNIVESLGYLIATWEYRTYITATMLDINPFDQFGVNAGKKYTSARKFIKDSS